MTSFLKNSLKFRLFLLRKLPMGYLAGLKIRHLDEQSCAVTIRYKYLTQNPFRSIYFACLAMAAELSTGVLGLTSVFKSSRQVSMLVVHLDAEFLKKAVGEIVFTCQDGLLIQQAIQKSILSGEGQKVTATSTGLDEQGNEVARFRITWSFKAKNR